MTPARDQAKALLEDQEARRMAEIEEQIRLARPIDGFEPWEEPVDEREGQLLAALILFGFVAVIGAGVWWGLS